MSVDPRGTANVVSPGTTAHKDIALSPVGESAPTESGQDISHGSH